MQQRGPEARVFRAPFARGRTAATLFAVLAGLIGPSPPSLAYDPYIGQYQTAGGLSGDWDSLGGHVQETFTVTDPPPVVVGHHVAWTWTFQGCGAWPTTISWDSQSGQDPPPVRVDFYAPGEVSIAYVFTDYDDPLSSFSLEGTYYVIGGSMVVTMQSLHPDWAHDARNPANPWYLTFHGFDPGSGLPDYAQAPALATLS